jgi:hypothetical protein
MEIIQLICNIYIDNYLNSTEHQPWERSLHYNSTINNVRKACQSDVEQTDWPHVSYHFKRMFRHLDHSKIVQEIKVKVSSFRQQQEVLKSYLLKIKSIQKILHQWLIFKTIFKQI